MFGNHFYHERIRKSVATFGAMFNDIYVIRKNKSTGNVISQVKVPLSYAPRQKFLERIRENPDLNTTQSVAIKLPRMSFEITSIAYDPARQLQKVNNVSRAGTDVNTRAKMYSGVPYNLGFQLSIYAKTQDDALQVVEQVVPYFNPQYTLTVKPFDDYPDITEDVPITLVGVDFTDDFEGPVEQRRTIIYTLSFEMKVMFHGPHGSGAIIRKAINNVYDLASGDQISKIEVTPNPADADPDDDYGFNTLIDVTNPFDPYLEEGYVADGYIVEP